MDVNCGTVVDGEDTALLKPVARALQAQDALRANPHGGLEFGPAARAILKGDAEVALVERETPPRQRRRAAGAEANPNDDPLFEALRVRRRELAKEASVPPYVIFHDSVLRDMAARRPTDRVTLGMLTSIGARKLDAYGEAFLEVIRTLG